MSRSHFDTQATTYDERAGLPDEACAAVAAAVHSVGGIAPGDLVLDLGAGTGAIGMRLARLPGRYVGLDVSRPMLDAFRCRLSAEACDHAAGGLLLHADANRTWPLRDGSARVIFSSRAIHWLDVGHVVDETCRVAAPRAALVLGRVRRDPDGARALVREEMRRELERRGVAPRDVQQRRRLILAACRARGGEPIEAVEVARWSVLRSPSESIEAWRQKPGLAGVDPPDDVKASVLAAVTRWARDAFADPDEPVASEEAYVIEGVRLGGEAGR